MMKKILVEAFWFSGKSGAMSERPEIMSVRPWCTAMENQLWEAGE